MPESRDRATQVRRPRAGGTWREPVLAIALSAPLVVAMLLVRSALEEGFGVVASTEHGVVWTAAGAPPPLNDLPIDPPIDSPIDPAMLVIGATEAISPTGAIAMTEAILSTEAISPTPTTMPTPSISPTPTDTPLPTDTPTPGPETVLPIIPPIDDAMKARLRAIHQAGLARGIRPDVFAKIGDSITASRYFLVDIGCGGARFDESPEHAALAGIVQRFSAAPVGPEGSTGPCGAPNSFTRRGFAAASGWTAARALSSLGNEVTICPPPFDTPLRCELETIKPSIALIMFGTNDLQQRVPPDRFRFQIERIAAETFEAGVIPVLGTIPPRGDAAWSSGLVGAYNGAIVDAAAATGAPLWNSWRAMAEPAAAGRSLAPDGIHPSVGGGRSSNFRGEAAMAGYNGRNLGALQVLARIARVVLDDGPPEP